MMVAIKSVPLGLLLCGGGCRVQLIPSLMLIICLVHLSRSDLLLPDSCLKLRK